MIYLDNSATTQPCAACVEAMTQALTTDWGNPSSLHAVGFAANRRLAAARAQVANALGCEPARLTFTAGGTEADNWATFSTAERLGKRGRHIITTAIEHEAVLRPMQKLEAKGFEVTYLQPDETGVVPLEALRAALRKDTILVSIMMVNNETGAIQPISEMAKLTHRLSPLALFHTDAVQGFLKIPFSARTLGADLISISGHKVHAAKGVGALYMKEGLHLPPYLLGGGQEAGYRSGTENLPAICGFGAACAAFERGSYEAMRALRSLARQELSRIDGLRLIGPEEAAPIVSLSLPHLRSQGVINCLQDRGVYVSAGSACAKGHRSHVLEAMKLPPVVIDGAIRASFSTQNSEADVMALCEALRYAKQTLKG